MIYKKLFYYVTCPEKNEEICLIGIYDVGKDPDENIGDFHSFECPVIQNQKAFYKNLDMKTVPICCTVKHCRFNFPEKWNFDRNNNILV